MSLYAVNLLIHSRVMGFTIPSYKTMLDEATRVWETQPNVCYFFQGFDYVDGTKRYPVFRIRMPDYSRDLNEAVAAIERVSIGSTSPSWDAEARLINGKRRFAVNSGGCWGYSDTLVLAICLCALRLAKVSEVDIENANLGLFHV